MEDLSVGWWSVDGGRWVGGGPVGRWVGEGPLGGSVVGCRLSQVL